MLMEGFLVYFKHFIACLDLNIEEKHEFHDTFATRIYSFFFLVFMAFSNDCLHFIALFAFSVFNSLLIFFF